MKQDYGEFAKICGPTPRNIILEFFLALRTLDYGIGDIAEECGLNRATTYNTMSELIKEKLIIHSRMVGRTQLYKLNTTDSNVKKLIEMFDLLLAKIAEEYEEGDKILIEQ